MSMRVSERDKSHGVSLLTMATSIPPHVKDEIIIDMFTEGSEELTFRNSRNSASSLKCMQ